MFVLLEVLELIIKVVFICLFLVLYEIVFLELEFVLFDVEFKNEVFVMIIEVVLELVVLVELMLDFNVLEFLVEFDI